MRLFPGFSFLAIALSASVPFLVCAQSAYGQPRDNDFITVATTSDHRPRSEGKGLSDTDRILELLDKNLKEPPLDLKR